MSRQHIPNMTIKEFRGIGHLSLTDLGKVNLIAGENSSGTTSVLEAIHIYTGLAGPDVIKEVLDGRAENPGEHRGNGENLVDFLAVNSMLRGFPQDPHSPDPISITTSRIMPPRVVQIQLKLLTEVTNEQGLREFTPQETSNAVEPRTVPALVIDTQEGTRNHPLTSIFRTGGHQAGTRMKHRLRDQPASILLSRHHRRDPAMWDQVALTNNEKYVKRALEIMERQVINVSMIGNEDHEGTRTTVVQITGRPRPVPLRSMGEGINRCYDIALAAVRVPAGILLIDQIEDSLSPKAQLELWQTLLVIAREKDVQIFASTHSPEAVQAFRKAAEGSSEDSRCIQLEVSNDKHVQTVQK